VYSSAVPWQRLLTVEILQLHVFQSFLHKLPCWSPIRTVLTVIQDCISTQLTNELIAPTVLVITSRHGPHRKHRSCIVVFMSVATGTCLPSLCPETAVVFLLSRHRCVAATVHAIVLKTAALWAVTTCSLVGWYWCFRVIFCLELCGWTRRTYIDPEDHLRLKDYAVLGPKSDLIQVCSVSEKLTRWQLLPCSRAFLRKYLSLTADGLSLTRKFITVLTPDPILWAEKERRNVSKFLPYTVMKPVPFHTLRFWILRQCLLRHPGVWTTLSVQLLHLASQISYRISHYLLSRVYTDHLFRDVFIQHVGLRFRWWSLVQLALFHYTVTIHGVSNIGHSCSKSRRSSPGSNYANYGTSLNIRS
jgi:hypothetical protein